MNVFEAVQGLAAVVGDDNRERFYRDLSASVRAVLEAWPEFLHGHDEVSVELEEYKRYIVRARMVSIDVEARALCDELASGTFFDPVPMEETHAPILAAYTDYQNDHLSPMRAAAH